MEKPCTPLTPPAVPFLITRHSLLRCYYRDVSTRGNHTTRLTPPAFPFRITVPLRKVRDAKKRAEIIAGGKEKIKATHGQDPIGQFPTGDPAASIFYIHVPFVCPPSVRACTRAVTA